MLESKPMFSTKPLENRLPVLLIQACRCVDDDDNDDDGDDYDTTWRLCIEVVLHIIIGER